MARLSPIVLLSATLLCCSACRAPHSTFLPTGDDTRSQSEITQAAFEQPIDPIFSSPQPTASSPSTAASAPLRVQRIESLEQLAPEQQIPADIDFVLRQAIANSAVIRDPHQFLSPGNGLLKNPDQVASSLNPKIQASSPSGVEAALAAFDAQLAAGAQWGQDSLVQTNNFFTGNVAPANILVSDSGSAYGRLDQATASGGLVSLVHNWNYTPDSLPSRDFNSRYVGFLRAELRQPLLAGRGWEVTDIAGPASISRGQLGRGVRVARIDENISIAEFESQLQRLLKQVQEAYWDLWLAHQTYHKLAASRDSARGLLDRIRARGSAGLGGGDAVDEAQADETYLLRESAVNDTLAEVLQSEGRLRRLVGMPVNEGQVLVPTQQPFDGEVILDWQASVAIASASRTELRQQQMRIKSLEYQFHAADNHVLPQLDLVAGVQANGFGDDVFSGGSGSGGGAYGSIFGAEHAGWNVGMEFSTPLGRRASRARRRHLQQRLGKARQVLRAQEEEIRHELAYSYNEIDRTYKAVDLARRRTAAAAKRQRAAAANFDAGRSTVDLVLRAQAAVADADRSFLRSLVAYNNAIVDLKYREGRLLDEHHLSIETETQPGLL